AASPIAFQVVPPSPERNTPRPHEEELRLFASPLPTHTTCGFFCHTATAPIDATGCLSNTGFQVVPALVVLNTPPVPNPMKNVDGLLSTTPRLEIRPPMLAGPIERHARSLKSLGSSAVSPRAADALADAAPAGFAEAAPGPAASTSHAAPTTSARRECDLGMRI